MQNGTVHLHQESATFTARGPAMRNRPARDISINYYKNMARRFLMSFKPPKNGLFW